MIPANYRKATQALNYFARKKDGKINKMKAIKLIYLADRYHLRKYGRPVVGDTYWAMKYGPVGSDALRIANLEEKIGEEGLRYASGFIAHPSGDANNRTIVSKKSVDLDVFSQTDIEALESVYKQFGGYDEFELADLTHKYPEWKNAAKDLDGTKRVKMEYRNFFSNPDDAGADFFDLPQDHLKLSREMFEESAESMAFLR